MAHSLTDLERERRERKARAIAQEVDPQAGGFFRRCLENAALKGMESVAGVAVAPAPTPDTMVALRAAQAVLAQLVNPDMSRSAGAIYLSAVAAEAKVRAAIGPPPRKEGGWYTHGCGQWVHDQLAPCSVCKGAADSSSERDAQS